jgi:transcriptional regulator with XRE-family HTH domain
VFDLHTEIEEFRNQEYRESYADEFLNTYVANQIRVVREQRGMTQQQLAEAIGTQQAGISRIENVNYSGWNIRTLKKIARALSCRLHISFETYGSLLEAGANFRRESLLRPSFEDDPKFKTSGQVINTVMQRSENASLKELQSAVEYLLDAIVTQRRSNPAGLTLPIYEQPKVREKLGELIELFEKGDVIGGL